MATTTEVLVTSDLSNTFVAEFYSSRSVWHMNPSFFVCFCKALSPSKKSVLRSKVSRANLGERCVLFQVDCYWNVDAGLPIVRLMKKITRHCPHYLALYSLHNGEK